MDASINAHWGRTPFSWLYWTQEQAFWYKSKSLAAEKAEKTPPTIKTEGGT